MGTRRYQLDISEMSSFLRYAVSFVLSSIIALALYSMYLFYIFSCIINFKLPWYVMFTIYFFHVLTAINKRGQKGPWFKQKRPKKSFASKTFFISLHILQIKYLFPCFSKLFDVLIPDLFVQRAYSHYFVAYSHFFLGIKKLLICTIFSCLIALFFIPNRTIFSAIKQAKFSYSHYIFLLNCTIFHS